jgi:PTS system mannose-specific IIB component/fructoselysine and glucoselysine-specific PTS system IIB component
MGIVVCRIDDRLVHGQVVIGWGRALEIERIILVDAAVAGSEFEQELYRMAVPAGIDIEFLEPATAPARLDQLAGDHRRTLILTGSVDTMTGLQRQRPALIRSVNLGGIHDGPGRREYLRYVYLTDAEKHDLLDLEAAGVHVTAQDLPTSRPIALASLGP